MDTMEMTKIVGAACGALLIYLMISWAGDSLYHVESGSHGGHDGKVVRAYVIEVEEASGTTEVEEGPSLEELMASADAEKGAKVFSKCKACHKLEDGANGVGPTLFGVVDRDIASIGGYGYSDVLTGLAGNWDAASLNGFLTSPKAFAPGTKMSFAGVKKATDRVNLISYLGTIGN